MAKERARGGPACRRQEPQPLLAQHAAEGKAGLGATGRLGGRGESPPAAAFPRCASTWNWRAPGKPLWLGAWGRGEAAQLALHPGHPSMGGGEERLKGGGGPRTCSCEDGEDPLGRMANLRHGKTPPGPGPLRKAQFYWLPAGRGWWAPLKGPGLRQPLRRTPARLPRSLPALRGCPHAQRISSVRAQRGAAFLGVLATCGR